MDLATWFRKGSTFALTLEPTSIEYCCTFSIHPSHDSISILFVILPLAVIVAFPIFEGVNSLAVLHIVLPISCIFASIFVCASALTITFCLHPFTIVRCLVRPSVLALSLLDIFLPLAFVNCRTILCVPSHKALPISHIISPFAIVFTDFVRVALLLTDHCAFSSLLVLLPDTSEG